MRDRQGRSDGMALAKKENYHEAIARVVKRIPKGRVASYHLVAIVAGYPRTARVVGRALQLASNVPWWRVLGADGSLRIMNPELRREQFDRLQAEGVVLDAKGRVDLERFGGRPRPHARGAVSVLVDPLAAVRQENVERLEVLDGAVREVCHQDHNLTDPLSPARTGPGVGMGAG